MLDNKAYINNELPMICLHHYKYKLRTTKGSYIVSFMRLQ